MMDSPLTNEAEAWRRKQERCRLPTTRRARFDWRSWTWFPVHPTATIKGQLSLSFLGPSSERERTERKRASNSNSHPRLLVVLSQPNQAPRSYQRPPCHHARRQSQRDRQSHHRCVDVSSGLGEDDSFGEGGVSVRRGDENECREEDECSMEEERLAEEGYEGW